MSENILALATFYLPFQNSETHLKKREFLHLHVVAVESALENIKLSLQTFHLREIPHEMSCDK